MEEIDKNLLQFKNINKKFDNRIIFENFNIDFYENQVNCIIGKSGCGKSTLLNIISGVIKNDSLELAKIETKFISYIFQDDRLIDWLTVDENIKMVIKNIYDKNKCEELCNKYLDLLGIKEYKNYYPQMLSGGVRQRVNIVRALIYPSQIIIMDEPFKSIDIINKEYIIKKFKELLKKEKKTVILVTHDIEEAIILADKIYMLGNEPLEIKKIINNDENLNKRDIYELI